MSESELGLATPRGSTMPPVSRRGTLPIVELFHSIQGEGSRSGEAATFIRFAGCNLRCTWCDTSYSWSAEGVRAAKAQGLSEIVEQVRERAVVLTGGEPMLHRRRLRELIAQLREHDVAHVTIESNATIFDQELIDAVDLWSLSPKLVASGEAPDIETIIRFLEAARRRVQLKFVVTGMGDWHSMWALLDELQSRTKVDFPAPIFVQPDGTRSDYDIALQELVDTVTQDTMRCGDYLRRELVRVTPQVHRVIWGPAARGV